ncbi:hypothetical protein ACQH8C_26740, partial [Escherichia coli]|uniref:hypothetical protein n=1 Tax=Escherichia coli TaxID=562 RepID=UPI003CF4F4D7
KPDEEGIDVLTALGLMLAPEALRFKLTVNMINQLRILTNLQMRIHTQNIIYTKYSFIKIPYN